MLEPATDSRWWNQEQDRLVSFVLTDAVQALRSGNVVSARYVLEATRPRITRPEQAYRYRSAAVVNCRGHCGVLDVLRDYLDREASVGVYSFSSDYMLRIQHARVARWFVDQFGPSSLPSELIVAAVRRGQLGLYYYLRKVQGQDHAGADRDATSSLNANQQRIRTMLSNYFQRTTLVICDELVRAVLTTEDTELIEQVVAEWSPQCSAAVRNEATGVLQRLRLV